MTDTGILSYVHSHFCSTITTLKTGGSPLAPRSRPQPPLTPLPSEWPLNNRLPYIKSPIDKLMPALTKISFNELPSNELGHAVYDLMLMALYKIKDPQQRRKHELVLLLKYHGDYLLGIDAVDRRKVDMIKEWVALRQKLGPIFPLHATIVLRKIGHRFHLPLELQREIFSYLNTDHISEFCEEPYLDLITMPEKPSVEDQSFASKAIPKLIQDQFSRLSAND